MIEITKERVDLGYLLATLDFSALQTRLALIDTCLNDSGLDKSLWNVYRPDSDCDDLHSKTGFSIFIDSTKKKVIEVILPSNEAITFLPTERVVVNRGGIETTIVGSDIKDTDDWVGFP
jgi:hypothetical protein